MNEVTTKTLKPHQYLDRNGNVRTRAIRHSLAQRRLAEQDLIRYWRDLRPDDENLIESGTARETEDSLVYIYDVLQAEGERG